VETMVDFGNKRVKWNVAGTVRATTQFEALGDRTRTFRPYIEMYNTNDVV
jgi:hypothetical protein